MRWRRIDWALAAAFLACLTAAAPGHAETVDVALVLAADVSRSIDNDEFRLQREGYAAAIASPQVLQAVRAGVHGAIAVSFVEWSGPDEQAVVVDWTIIRDDETAATFATTLLDAPRSFVGRTSISAAIDFSMARLAASGVAAERRVIDVSGDGTNNAGRLVTTARDEAVAAGVTINGLAIINDRPNPGYFAHTQPPEGLPNYYRMNVVGGPAAFLLVVEDFKSFGEAMTNKLLTEIAGRSRPPSLAAAR
jgi:hypothetical protein